MRGNPTPKGMCATILDWYRYTRPERLQSIDYDDLIAKVIHCLSATGTRLIVIDEGHRIRPSVAKQYAVEAIRTIQAVLPITVVVAGVNANEVLRTKLGGHDEIPDQYAYCSELYRLPLFTARPPTRSRGSWRRPDRHLRAGGNRQDHREVVGLTGWWLAPVHLPRSRLGLAALMADHVRAGMLRAERNRATSPPRHHDLLERQQGRSEGRPCSDYVGNPTLSTPICRTLGSAGAIAFAAAVRRPPGNPSVR